MSSRILWRKSRLYKRFEYDIWGFYVIAPLHYTQISKLLVKIKEDRRAYYLSKHMRYVYDLRYMKSTKPKKRFDWKYLSRKFTKFFYLTLDHYQFRKLSKIAAKMEGSFESNYIQLVEGRILTLIYRMNWMYSVFQIKTFIQSGYVTVNNKVISLCNFSVNYGDFIKLRSKEIRTLIRSDIIRRLSKGIILFNSPRFLYINYKFMFGFIWKEPRKIDLAYTVKLIDIFRGADVY